MSSTLDGALYDDECQIIVQMKKAEGCSDFIVIDSVENSENFIVIDSVGNTEKIVDEELKVVYEKDETGLFFLDTTPQPINEDDESQKSMVPKETHNQSLKKVLSKPKDIANLYNQSKLKIGNRYHMMDKQPRKFSQFKPGVISRDLHNALGLKITEIPMHIYQMRLYGYPPGWLEDITEYPSGLDFVDSHNSPTEGYDQNITYDVERLVSFPGFNVPLDPRVTDDWRNLNFPPIQVCHKKENMINELKNKMKHWKKRFRTHHSRKEIFPDEETKDLDDDSIESLEKHRKNLLAELQEEEERGPTTSSELEKKTRLAESINDVPSSAPIQSKFLSAGTPVSIRHSPYARLPAPESFATNMSDMELFKNLPNSTGNFQKNVPNSSVSVQKK